MDITSKEFYLPFVKKEQLTDDCYSLYFDRSTDQFEFLPGQYVRMFLPHEKADERGINRLFTVASSPLNTDYVMITTRIIKSSFKHALLKLKSGDKIKFFGPQGGFVLDESDNSPHVFLAGGIGITPFHSMITFAAAKKLPTPIMLFVSFSTIKEVIYQKELEEIAKQHPSIKIIYTVTHPQNSQTRWSEETGRISPELIKKYVQNIQSAQYFIVGPPAMVTAMEDMVSEMGIKMENIRVENFTGY